MSPSPEASLLNNTGFVVFIVCGSLFMLILFVIIIRALINPAPVYVPPVDPSVQQMGVVKESDLGPGVHILSVGASSTFMTADGYGPDGKPEPEEDASQTPRERLDAFFADGALSREEYDEAKRALELDEQRVAADSGRVQVAIPLAVGDPDEEAPVDPSLQKELTV